MTRGPTPLRRASLLPGLLALVLGLGAAAPDPGILFSLDRERFELLVRDRARQPAETGSLRLRVAVGSPARPTPRGSYALERLILNPGWTPGPTASAQGAQPEAPSRSSPMGVAKIPFGRSGAFALHGGAIPLVLGKPISAGCIRVADADLQRLIDWLAARDALAAPKAQREGEIHRIFRRPVRLVTH